MLCNHFKLEWINEWYYSWECTKFILNVHTWECTIFYTSCTSNNITCFVHEVEVIFCQQCKVFCKVTQFSRTKHILVYKLFKQNGKNVQIIEIFE